MAVQTVDYIKVLKCIDEKRLQRGLSWRQVAADTGVPTGTFNRLRKGNGCMDGTFVSLMCWLGAEQSIKPFLMPIAEGDG